MAVIGGDSTPNVRVCVNAERAEGMYKTTEREKGQ